MKPARYQVIGHRSEICEHEEANAMCWPAVVLRRRKCCLIEGTAGHFLHTLCLKCYEASKTNHAYFSPAIFTGLFAWLLRIKSFVARR